MPSDVDLAMATISFTKAVDGLQLIADDMIQRYRSREKAYFMAMEHAKAARFDRIDGFSNARHRELYWRTVAALIDKEPL